MDRSWQRRGERSESGKRLAEESFAEPGLGRAGGELDEDSSNQKGIYDDVRGCMRERQSARGGWMYVGMRDGLRERERRV